MGWLHTWHPSPIAFSTSSLSVSWYGLVLVAGVVVGLLLVRRLWRRAGIALDHLYGIVTWLIIGGLIGGRIGHVIGEWDYYSGHLSELFSIWHGGLAIQGILIVGLIILWVYTRRQRLSFWQVTDLFVVVVPLVQAIGRWGNYFNQELFGKPASVPWAIPIDAAHRPVEYASVVYFHPLFLYESLLMLELFIVLFVLYRKQALRTGEYTLLYFMLFPVVRFSLDFLRIDMLAVGPLLLSQWISIAFIIGAGWLWWHIRQRQTPSGASER
ncbi:MAG: prolipoprotein diacylglyceryl transferase [Candidatus Kerfeldbacteria bacterium]|nr:prolipoprotein diacylglyceryl transferase [Candidatus Kerfeldbacteria bacterium]